MDANWQTMRATTRAAHGKKCAEDGVAFSGLHSRDWETHGVIDVLHLKGELLRNLLHGAKVQRRKGADCIFLLLLADGTVRIVIVELKSGRDKAQAFGVQLDHSTEDVKKLAAVHQLRLCAEIGYAAPRLPDAFRGNRRLAMKRWPLFEPNVDSLGDYLDKMG